MSQCSKNNVTEHDIILSQIVHHDIKNYNQDMELFDQHLSNHSIIQAKDQ